MAGLLSTCETSRPCEYTLCGLFLEREPKTARSFKEIPDLGIAIHPTAAANPTYLVSLDGEGIAIREVRQRAGGVRFAIDQLVNENTVALRPDGRYGNDVLLAGQIGTASTSPQSRALFKILANLMRQRFSKMNVFYLGSEALKAWKAGARLTIAVQSPPEFDLRRLWRGDIATGDCARTCQACCRYQEPTSSTF
jgi:hypothetical protein